MKKLACLALVAIVAVGCSEEDKFDSSDNSPVEIKVNSGIYEVLRTKAPVNSGDSITVQFAASVTSGNYATNAWSASIRFKASATPTAALSFTPQQFYPIDGSSIYIKGYYPSGSLSGNTVTFSGANGTNDVMVTAQASGTRATTTPLNFVFNHLLAQLQFKFVAGSGYDPTGKTVKSVTVKTQQIPATLDLGAGTIGYTAGDATITGTYAISVGGSTAADCPMVKPGEVVTISVTNSDNVTYPDITFTTAQLLTLAGNSHLITITFNHKEITATVSVTDWVVGGGGTASAS